MRTLLCCCLLLLGVPVQAGEVVRMTVPATVQAEDGTPLQLNGTGIRSKFFFDIYRAELYLAEPSREAEGVIGAPGPKRLIMHFLYDQVARDKLVASWSEGFAANSGTAAALQDRIAQFNAMFSDIKKGEEIVLDFVPEQGTVVTVAGRQKGVIAGKDFNDALLRIWLGSKPVSQGLKEALLGGGR